VVPESRLRHRVRIVLHMVMAFVIMLLLTQLWLFTVMLEAMESGTASPQVAIAALVCSLIACTAVWALIRLFLRVEARH